MDPKWPKATLSGTLPNLTLHVNEQKVNIVLKYLFGCNNINLLLAT